MRRWLLKSVVFLLLGAIINVALAWLCTVRPVERWFDRPLLANGVRRVIANPESGEILSVTLHRGHGWVIVDTRFWQKQVDATILNDSSMTPATFDAKMFNARDADASECWAAWSRLNDGMHDVMLHRGESVAQCAFGWPWLSLKYKVVARSRGMRLEFSPASEVVRIGGIRVSKTGSVQREKRILPARALPLIPIWPGFILNTALYSLVLWLVIGAPKSIRRGLRQRCGQCLTCGYDLRGAVHDACPECGRRFPGVKPRVIEPKDA